MVTTVSVTTVTTVTSIVAMGLAAAVTTACTILLISLLAGRELALASGSGFFARFGRALAVGIGPLLIVFGLIVVLRIAQILG